MPDNSMKARFNRTLMAAQRNYEKAPTLANTVCYGRVLGFRYQYDDAISVFSKGLARYPDAFELYRQRGHRYISIRQFEAGLADLKTAARLIEGMDLWIEPDREGNELPIPPTSIQSNTFYHLGLAHHLLRNWSAAADAFGNCHQWSDPYA